VSQRRYSRSILSSAVAVLMALVTVLVGPTMATAAPDRTVQGTIRLEQADGTLQTAAAGEVVVQFTRLGEVHDPADQVATDAAGAYTIAGLEPDLYYLWLDYTGSEGYLDQWYQSGYVAVPALGVNTSSSQTTYDGSANLWLPSSISGTVSLGSEGSAPPAGDVSISYQRLIGTIPGPGGFADERTDWIAGGSVASDGTYELIYLPPSAAYLLRFDYVGDDGYNDTWYYGVDGYYGDAGTSRLNAAMSIPVHGPAATGKDVVIPPKGEITGTVLLGEDGVAPAPGEVTITPYVWAAGGDHEPLPDLSVTNDAGGAFTFTAMNSRMYVFGFTYTGAGLYAPETLRTDNTVLGEQVDWVIPDTLVSSGRVFIDDSSHPAVAGQVRVEALKWLDNAVVASTETDANGNWSLLLPAGDYRLQFTYLATDRIYPQWYYRAGSPGEFDSSIASKITGQAGQSGLDVIIGGGYATLRGIATDSTGAPTPGINVLLYHQVVFGGEFTWELVETVTTLADGGFQFVGRYVSPPGDDQSIYTIDFEDPSGVFSNAGWPGNSYYYSPFGFEVLQPVLIDDFDITMLKPGTITGKVERSGFVGSTSDMWVEVVVYDYGTGAWVRTGDTYDVASNGTYTIPDIYPDFYRVWAYYDGPAGRAQGITTVLEVTELGTTTGNVAVKLGVTITPQRMEAQAFVYAAYEDVLGRTPSPSEALGWIDGLVAGQPRSWVANGFNNSYEYRLNKINEAYDAVFGREGDAAGIQNWLHEMALGHITSDDPHRQFLWSWEFYHVTGGGTPVEYIDALYWDQLQRGPDPGGMQNWLRVLAAEGQVAVVNGFWFAEETYRARISEQFVHLLGRSPSAGELTHWVGMARTYGITSVRGLLMESDEYWDRAQIRF
jgi:hypothetical protein